MLLREIRMRGYGGGVTQLKEHPGSIRPQLPTEPIGRFETDPRKQLQIDFVDFRRGVLSFRAFMVELGYWRYAFVEFTDNERTETLVACLERALEFFGGVTDYVSCENPKTIVIERNAYAVGRHRYNLYLREFARHYGLTIKPCSTYRSQAKGKIDRFPPLLTRVALRTAANWAVGPGRRRDGES